MRLAIIDHDNHRLWIEDVKDSVIELCGGEQEYIEDSYELSENYSWDYIVDAEYIPIDSADPIEINFEEL